MNLYRVLALAAMVAGCVPGRAAQAKILSGHLVSSTKGLSSTGRVAANRQLNLAIGLPLGDPAGLTSLLAELYNPASTNFHHWLTPEEFTARFGPSEDDYASVVAFAQTNGLMIVGTHPNRLLLDVRGAAADVERAFHLNLRTYQHPHEAREFFAPDAEPAVPPGLPVADVSGLSDFGRPHPLSHVQPLGVVANGTGSAGGAYIGNDFRAAYVPGSSLNGSNQIVGLVQFDGFYASDITAYEAQAGLPNVLLQTVLIDGFSGTPTTGSGSGNNEVSLDIEMVISMAPGVAKILVYEGSPNNFIPNDVLNRIATDNQAKQISSSWSWTGGPSTTTDAILQQYITQGQTYFTASGDSDAYTGANVLDSSSASTTPVDSPYLTSVGGTTLTTTGAGGDYVSESVWNRGSNVGSSGGISSHYAIPSWQINATLVDNQRSTTLRNIPDVSLVGENVYVKYGNGLSGVFGGTSCAAPLWAGFMALVNQQGALGLRPTVGFLNPPLYALAESANYAATFHDVTAGNNNGSNTPGLYNAVAGYDLCTGWGTPTGTNLINALAPWSPTPVILAGSAILQVESATPANGAIDPGETVSVSLTLLNGGGEPTTNLVATLLPSTGIVAPSAPQTYGVLPAGGGAASRTFTFTAAGVCGGTITNVLQLQDGTTDFGTVSYAFTLGSTKKVQVAVQSFDSVTLPALPDGWTSTNLAGTATSWVSTTASKDSPPNAAYLADGISPGENALVSPPLAIHSSSAQLVFRQSYRLESSRGTFYDGGVLEVRAGSGSFIDILAAGGSFASNGYTSTISLSSDNPLGGRQAWCGNGSTWRTVVANLPAAFAGQDVQFRWVLATDTANSGTVTGWYVDSVSLIDVTGACTTVFADLATTLSLDPNSLILGHDLAYTITVTNAGPQAATGVAVTGSIPDNAAFVSATPPTSPGLGSLNWQLGTLAAGASSNFTVTFASSGIGPFTATATAIGLTPDPIATNNAATLTITQSSPMPANVASEPSDIAVVLGGTAKFSVIGGGTGPLAYQWYFNGVTALDGATAPTLTLTNVQTSQAGNYLVVVTNAYGSATSDVAVLTVLLPPGIAAQPESAAIPAGSNVTFAVSATGTGPLFYQWFFNGTNALAGATSMVLMLNDVQAAQSGCYSVQVTNDFGAIHSSNAMLTVLAPPAITLQPQPQAVPLRSNAIFSVSASGTAPMAYQWYFNDTNLVAGATAATIILTNVQPNQAGDYSVTITNLYGFVSSKGAELTILLPPTITTQPQPQSALLGADASFSVAASGSGSLAYQWFFNGTNLLAGATSATLSLPGILPNQGGAYSAVVSNAYGSATSSNALLTVLGPPRITGQPQDWAGIAGSNASFTVSVAGPGPLSYQWFFNSTNLLADAIDDTLSITNVLPEQAGPYSVVVTNAYGSATSSNALLTILVPPALTDQPQNQTVIAGATVTFNTIAEGTGPLTYQWFFNGTNLLTSGNDWIVLTNAQPAQAGVYSVTVTNAAGKAASSPALLRVLVPPALTATNLQLTAAQPAIGLQSVAGLIYTLEFTESFAPPDWLPAAPPVTGTGGFIFLADTNVPPTVARFYRVRCE